MTLLQNIRLLAFSSLLAGALALAGTGAARADTPPPENVISLTATSTLEVTKDQLTVVLHVVREGTEAAGVQAQLKQVLETALAEAKKSAQPGALEVRTGSFTIQPRYGRDGRINGWQGSAELVLEGRDTARVAQVAGRVQGMNVTATSYSVSRELREKHEAELGALAIQQFRNRATAYSKQFGFPNYVVREVSVSLHEPGMPVMPVERSLPMASMRAVDASLPTEPGKGILGATVQGSVQMLR